MRMGGVGKEGGRGERRGGGGGSDKSKIERAHDHRNLGTVLSYTLFFAANTDFIRKKL